MHGSSTNYEETGGNWLSMGANDIDESGGLGTDGWLFFGNFNNAQQNNQPFSLHVQSAPSYVSSISEGANFVSVAEEFGGYGSLDNPNLLNGTDRRGGFALGTTGGAGSSNEVVIFEVSSLEPGRIVRVGILAGLEGNADGRWDPTSITLSMGGSSATVGNHSTSPLPANPGGTNTGWVFFDLDSNGTYAVSVTKRLSGQGAGIGGLTFDSEMTLDITNPADSDSDGMGDNWETFYFGNLSRDGSADFDNDGRTDLEEWGDGTNPTLADVDGDGLNDGEEHTLGTDPFNEDSDGDGWNDGEEVTVGADPNSNGSVPSLATAREAYPTLPMTRRDAVVVFNEIHYHPAADDSSLEYVELYNQLAVDVDLSNWRLAGDVDFDFPEGSVIPARGYLVVAQNPAALESATGHSGALGPFEGVLSNSGGHLLLYNNNRSFRSTSGGTGSPGEIREDNEARRIMDEIDYSDVSPWPVGADGSGATLAKRDPATGTPNPFHWVASPLINGTPGRVNLSVMPLSLSINEVSPTTDASFRVELMNYGSESISLSGLILASSNPAHPNYVLPGGALGAGGFLSIDAATLGFTPEDNNRLFLYGQAGLTLVDAARVDDRAIARSPDGTGRWLRPGTATFGNANSFSIEDAIVINEIFYHAYPQMQPFVEREEEWLELYNRSGAPVNLSGWKIEGGIRFNFPVNTIIPSDGYLVVAKDSAALAVKHSGITILGDYSGRLGDGGDLIVLADPVGNPADEVRYYDSAKWHSTADGGGASLELRDPDADNEEAGAWAASDESSRSGWQTYTYEGVAEDDGVGHNLWHELQLGLLDAGEFLLDDVSVIENGSIEMMQNGDFESDALGATAQKWRAIGTHGSHGQTFVVSDPDDSSNQCLRVVATGPTENKHNKLETTFANGEEIVAGNTYQIQFRVKWISGSNQLNSRLFFNYLQRTTHLDVPEVWGTPGVANSRAVTNLGPVLSGLSHSPVVPDAGEAVVVGIDANDSDGIQGLVLFYSINDGALSSTSMSLDPQGRFIGTIPGQSAGATIRFHVRGIDAMSAQSFFPASGAEGGAFYQVQDGRTDSSGLRHNVRVVMDESDRAFLFNFTNRMSNDRFPVTLIVNEETAYYDVQLRLKASGFGRHRSTNYGFNIRFQPDQLFRGVHRSISIERHPDLREILAKNLMNRASGGYWSFYEDVSHIITPTSGDSAVGLLSMARQTNAYFDSLFPEANQQGTLFNQELLYSPREAEGGVEGFKLGDSYNLTRDVPYDMRDRGADKEAYRWGFQIRSARDRDDYSKMIEVNQAFELDGAALKAAIEPLIDVDQWMRTFAMMTLNGTRDVYTRIWEHNFRYFVRPTDQKMIVMQWDLDSAFDLAVNTPAIPTVNRSDVPVSAAKLFEIPEYRRLFDGHVRDLIDTTFNSSFATPMASHLSSVTGKNFDSYASYIPDRANFVQGVLPSSSPFVVTTNAGGNFSVSDSVFTLQGNAWVDVYSIRVNGVDVAITWVDSDTWRIDVPLQIGANFLTIEGLNFREVPVGSDTITITNTGTTTLANVTNTVISELHYHPADPSAAEIEEGFTDKDDFEFIEITNIDPSLDVDLTNVHFTEGVTFSFPSGTTLAAGERLVLVANQAAFEFRYGMGAAVVAGVYTGRFKNSGEQVVLNAADASVIADFTYGEDSPWPSGADGGGYSLVYSGADPDFAGDWRTSVGLGGNPGNSDSVTYAGGDIIAYSLNASPEGEVNGDEFLLNVRVNLGADDVQMVVCFSTDLINWEPADVSALVSRTNHGDGTATLSFRSPDLISSEPKQFGVVHLELR